MRALLLAFILATAWPAESWAQDKPNFSGTWTLDASKSDTPLVAGRAGGGGRAGRGGLGALGGVNGPVVITQTDTEIAIGPVTYKLNGTSTPIGGGRGAAAQAKAAWEGSKLVIEVTRDVQGTSLTTKQVRSLDSTGKEMRVEITVNAPRGERTVTQVFTKTDGA